MMIRILPLLLLCAALLPAEDWFIAGETRTISVPTVHEGNIVILSGGVLDIGADFTQTGFIAVFAGGLLKVHDCDFRLQSTYNGQYFIAALETGRIEMGDIRFSSNGWQAGIIALDDGSADIRGSDFFLEPAGVTQPGMYGRGRITLEDSRGDFEVILLDAGCFEAKRIPPLPEDPARTRLWVWPTFGDGDIATLTYPAPGVQDFTFPGPGDTTAFSYILDDVNIPFWPLLVKPGSTVLLKDNPEDRHLIVGHLLYRDAVLTLRNNTDYDDFTLPVSDRSFRMVNSRVWTWNLYPYEDTVLVVKDSVLGEILGSEQSRTWVYDSTIDGSGGFLGASGDASITLVHSTVSTMVQSVDHARIGFIRSSLQPHPAGIPSYLTLAGEGSAALMETDPPEIMVLGGSYCLPYTRIITWQPEVWLQFEDICQSGNSEGFFFTITVEDTRTHAMEELQVAYVDSSGMHMTPLPEWCLPPCTCEATLSLIHHDDVAYHYTETLCADWPHGRPVERP
jgi:hypothetical protein